MTSLLGGERGGAQWVDWHPISTVSWSGSPGEPTGLSGLNDATPFPWHESLPCVSVKPPFRDFASVVLEAIWLYSLLGMLFSPSR